MRFTGEERKMKTKIKRRPFLCRREVLVRRWRLSSRERTRTFPAPEGEDRDFIYLFVHSFVFVARRILHDAGDGRSFTKVMALPPARKEHPALACPLPSSGSRSGDGERDADLMPGVPSCVLVRTLLPSLSLRHATPRPPRPPAGRPREGPQ